MPIKHNMSIQITIYTFSVKLSFSSIGQEKLKLHKQIGVLNICESTRFTLCILICTQDCFLTSTITIMPTF